MNFLRRELLRAIFLYIPYAEWIRLRSVANRWRIVVDACVVPSDGVSARLRAIVDVKASVSSMTASDDVQHILRMYRNALKNAAGRLNVLYLQKHFEEWGLGTQFTRGVQLCKISEVTLGHHRCVVKWSTYRRLWVRYYDHRTIGYCYRVRAIARGSTDLPPREYYGASDYGGEALKLFVGDGCPFQNIGKQWKEIHCNGSYDWARLIREMEPREQGWYNGDIAQLKKVLGEFVRMMCLNLVLE